MSPVRRTRTYCAVTVLACLTFFCVLAEGVHHGRAVTALDGHIAASFSEHSAAQPVVTDFFGFLTQVGGVPANVILTMLAAGVLFTRRRPIPALVVLLLASVGGLIDLQLKEYFARPRPATPAEWVSETNFSFPSGHSMGSVIGYGLLVYLLLPSLRRPRPRAAVVAGAAVLVALIGLSRVYLRAHYLSDVLAGFAAGTAWLVVGIALLELVQRRQRARELSRLELVLAAAAGAEEAAPPRPPAAPVFSEKSV